MIWTHHPQVAGGGDVELQPAFLGRPQPPGLQQEKVRVPVGRTGQVTMVSAHTEREEDRDKVTVKR